MKTHLKSISMALLLLNGIGALYGGWNLMIHPDGSSIQLSTEWLAHTPFTNYFIPGLILFVANGLLSMFVFITILMRLINNSILILAQGVILTGWIVTQIMMIHTVYFLHIIMGSVGVILILVGFIQWKYFTRYENGLTFRSRLL